MEGSLFDPPTADSGQTDLDFPFVVSLSNHEALNRGCLNYPLNFGDTLLGMPNKKGTGPPITRDPAPTCLGSFTPYFLPGPLGAGLPIGFF